MVTRLDHDGNVAPWLELARDRGLEVRYAAIDEECRLDLADLERQLTSRTRVVAFPLASNMAGATTDAARVSVVGPWNGWRAEADPLEPVASSGIWDGFVPTSVPASWSPSPRRPPTP